MIFVLCYQYITFLMIFKEVWILEFLILFINLGDVLRQYLQSSEKLTLPNTV
jgi:hypothetical protein